MNAVKEIKHVIANYFHRLTSEMEISGLRFDEYETEILRKTKGPVGENLVIRVTKRRRQL